MTPLHEAAYKQNEKTYQLLCTAKGCDLTSIDSFGYTAERYLLLSQSNSIAATTGALLS
jgi:ankyrin repeat protein